MLILPRNQIAHLVKAGTIDVWSPQRTAMRCDHCGNTLAHSDIHGPRRHRSRWDGPRCPRCHRRDPACTTFIPEPTMNVHHIVRRTSSTEAITRAKGIIHRAEALQDLTYPEALAAGFKTRDHFYDWWMVRYPTGPVVPVEPVPCWVVTYERETLDIPQFLATREVYTNNSRQALDVGEIETDGGTVSMPLESPDATDYAERSEQHRMLLREQAGVLWRARRRRKAA